MTDNKGFLCGKILGDLGVDVIKIEPPGGDPIRNIGPFYHDIPDPNKSLNWFAFNSNKRGITLNLETSDGQIIFKKLVETADFIIESFLPGYMSELGLSYKAISQINPRTIMTSITHFGQEGPYSYYKASDLVMCAMSGLMLLTGDIDRPPVRISFPQAYLHAGAEGAEGTLIAHYYREITGEGQWVDVSVQDSMNETPMNVIWHWDVNKDSLERMGPFRGGLTMGGMQRIIWKCKDGYICYTILGGPLGARSQRPIIHWMDTEGMAPDALKGIDWDTFDLATASQSDLDKISEALSNFFLTHTKAELYEEAVKRGFLLGPVANVHDILEDRQLKARDFWQNVEHPELGANITYPGSFLNMSETVAKIWRRAPLIGEHNQEIYQQELGFSKEKLIILKQGGII